MTTYYVRTSGDDGDDGLSPATAWLTIGKALGASGIASGDSVYIGAGVYREIVTIAMTSAVAETFVIGDVDGSMTGDAGEVVLSTWTSGDNSIPDDRANIFLAGRDHLTFRRLTFFSSADCLRSDSSAATFLTVEDCTFIVPVGSDIACNLLVPFGTVMNTTFDRCRFITLDQAIGFDIQNSSSGSDWDAAIVIRNCHIVSGRHAIYLNGLSALANRGGGLTVKNCTIFAGKNAVAATDTSATFPVTVTNCLIMAAPAGSSASALFAGAAGMIVEDYNALFSPSPRSDVSAGAHSHDDKTPAPSMAVGQEVVVGSTLRPFMAPTAGSAILGFGGSSPPSVDVLNNPRPSGGESALVAVGAYERGDTAAGVTGTVQAGANAIAITGPGYQDFDLAVPASLTTVNLYARFDSTYAGTKPKLQIINGTEAGVADASVTMTTAADTWERLSLSFTPTAAGIITVRVLSSDTDGGGVVFFDTFEVTYGAHVLGFNFRRGEPLQTLNGIIVESPGITEAREGLV